MKLALLGDIHGNADALTAVLDGVRREQVNQLLLTGDFVGYYYHPEKALRALEGWETHSVRGNHEDMLFSAQSNEGSAARYRARYGSGVDIALSCLSEAEMDMLRDLPVSRVLTLDGKQVLLAHGAPWDTDFYVYPEADEEVWTKMGALGVDYVVLGHTHYRFSKRIGDTLVINPGSVGQPRDRLPGAAWALLDTTSDVIEFFIEPYNIEAVANEAKARDPHLPYLWEVLNRH
jgi:putative phosphoesterase